MALERAVRAKVILQKSLLKFISQPSTVTINLQLASKRDPEQEREAQEWIESILGEKFTCPYEDALRDGQVLCHLINKLAPGSVPKINTTGAQFKLMENIQK